MRISYEIITGKNARKTLPGRRRRIREDNIKIVVEDIGW
jgi:hypothetical protein